MAGQANGDVEAAAPKGVSLSWRDIGFSVKAGSGGMKPVLRGVSGHVNAGELLCILGPSGCGKTSLINILARKVTRKRSHEVVGSVLCNGEELTATEFQRISGLVSQEDVFNSVLTVQETLRFAAKLKLPALQREERVEAVAAMLQLERCMKTRVGDDSNPYAKGISGGEKRRLAMAVEVLDPDIAVLILDEPTSGLDAAAALNVCNLMGELAAKGITICTTLHQPRSAIMKNFTQLMVLAAGKRMFYGAVGDYVPYLEGTIRAEVPLHESPFDLFLDVLNPAIFKESEAKVGAIPDGCDDVPEELAKAYESSELKAEMDRAARPGDAAYVRGLVQSRGQQVGWCGKCLTVLHRTFLIKCRDPIVLATLLSSAVAMGLIFGVLYWRSYEEKSKEHAVLDTQMAITMTVTMVVFLPYDVTLTFPRERKIFLRERQAGLYGTGAFFVARVAADMPLHVVSGAVLSAIVHGMAGLKCGFALFVAVNVFGILVGAALMQMIGALSRSFEEANLLMMIILMLSMVMSSAFVREIPSWLDWAREVSVMGLLADMAVYMELKEAGDFGEPAVLFETFAVRIRDDGQFNAAASVLAAIWVLARGVTWFAVKFLHTGRSFAENLRD